MNCRSTKFIIMKCGFAIFFLNGGNREYSREKYTMNKKRILIYAGREKIHVQNEYLSSIMSKINN